jgi:hypothetical protein
VIRSGGTLQPIPAALRAFQVFFVLYLSSASRLLSKFSSRITSGDPVGGDPSTNPCGAARLSGLFCFIPQLGEPASV